MLVNSSISIGGNEAEYDGTTEIQGFHMYPNGMQ